MMEQNENNRSEFSIRVGKRRIPVTKEVYLAYYTMGRRERYLDEQDRNRACYIFRQRIQIAFVEKSDFKILWLTFRKLQS